MTEKRERRDGKRVATIVDQGAGYGSPFRYTVTLTSFGRTLTRTTERRAKTITEARTIAKLHCAW